MVSASNRSRTFCAGTSILGLRQILKKGDMGRLWNGLLDALLAHPAPSLTR